MNSDRKAQIASIGRAILRGLGWALIEVGRLLGKIGRRTIAVGTEKPSGGESRATAQIEPVSSESRELQPRAPVSSRAERRAVREQRVTDAIIGFDFGTATTKAVVRLPYLPGKPAFTVSFASLAEPGFPHLLPGRLCELKDHSFSLTPSPGGSVFSGLKLALMNDGSHDDLARAAIFVGLATRHVRDFANQLTKKVGNYDFRWSMNLGIPSAGYGGRREHALFQQAATAGWRLSAVDDPITMERAWEAIETGPPAEDVQIVPEVAAEVVGYARSDRRQPGLHLMMDVGASTLDLSAFVLDEREGDDNYHILTALVERFGVHELHRRRLQVARGGSSHGAKIREAVLEEEPLGALPERAAAYVEEASDELLRDLDDVDEWFRKESTRALSRVVLTARKRDPRSRNWQPGLPLFLCGGGGQMSLFQEAIELSSDRIVGNLHQCGRLRTIPLESPSDLDAGDVSPEMFARLAVAYGLSYSADDIGQITPPDAIPDLPAPPRKPWEERFVDQSQT